MPFIIFGQTIGAVLDQISLIVFFFYQKIIIFQDRMGNFGGDAGGVFYDYYEEEYSDEDEDDYEAEVYFL